MVYIVINPNFTRLITASRTVPEQEDGALDEAATSHVGLPYASDSIDSGIN